jgi:hypothetical protein
MASPIPGSDLVHPFCATAFNRSPTLRVVDRAGETVASQLLLNLRCGVDHHDPGLVGGGLAAPGLQSVDPRLRDRGNGAEVHHDTFGLRGGEH